MRVKLYLFLMMMLMITLCINGCTTHKEGTTAISTTPTDQNSTATVIPSIEADHNEAGGYQYEQELNIVDDNYRNYYEIFVRSYCDSDGDGIGDFNGIISKLDYISDMGFNGIWLMPIMVSPSYHKYDTSDFYNVDPQYGSMEDFKTLISECHKRGIRLIIDYVFNHTSNQHPWFTQAVDYLEGLGEDKEPDLEKCPYVGYYHFTKEFNGSNDYHRAGNSDWYYECIFNYTQPDLALESDAVRVELEKVTKFWLELGLDGFRLDAAKEFFSGNTTKNTEVLHWISEYAKSIKPEVYMVGEVFDGVSAITSYYKSGITSLFNFPMAQYNGIIVSTVRKLGSYRADYFGGTLEHLNDVYRESNPDYIDAPFLSNHDTTRVSAQCMNNEELMKMAAGILLTLNGSPFVYYGEEIGMNSMGDKDENKRLPMQWSKTDVTGMTTILSGADEVEQKFDALDEQLQDPLSIVNYYKRALQIRNENPEIARGEMSMVAGASNENICVIKKVYKGSEILIVYNISVENAKVDLKTAGYGDKQIRGYLTVDGSSVILADGNLDMPCYSITILK